ncbi:MAG: aminoglycoside phosphotransferase family protein [Candidatus Sericytochromatia bacterium]
MKSRAIVPENLELEVKANWGAAGDAWLQSLPERIRTLQTSLGLKELAPEVGMSLHWVGHGLQQQQAVTLKLGIPAAEFAQEIRAMTRLQAHPHMVRLLDSAPDEGWMLMERVQPGDPLSRLDDDGAALEVWLSELSFVPATELDQQRFPDLRTWCRALWAPAPAIPESLLELARSQCHDLIESETASLLLHGDLHHDNLIRSESKGWVLIDPKGVIAGPEFELGAMLRNPYPHWNQDAELLKKLQLRLERIAADPRLRLERVMNWAFVQAVLAACWSSPDPGAMALWLNVARAFDELGK